MSETPMPSEPQDIGATAWRKSPTTVDRDRPVLLGSRIKRTWLEQSVSLLTVRFTGDLDASLRSLLDAAKASEDKNLPIVRLRSALMAKLEDVVRLDMHLGLRKDNRPAMELRRVLSDDSAGQESTEVKQQVVDILKRWQLDVLAPWAERNGLSEVAAPVRDSIGGECIDVQVRSQGLIDRGSAGQVSRPQFDLIAKHLAERLVGEELFPGLGPCELIADATSTGGSVELTTWPIRLPGSNSVFSMVARLSVATWPTNTDLYLKVVPVKRVWAAKVPGRKPNAPKSPTCYIFSPSMPVLPAKIRRGKEGWEFGDEYAQYSMESNGELPRSLEDAVAELMPKENGWWVGLPELTTLFDYVQQRTVFEGDEIDLFEKIVELLPDALEHITPGRILKMTRAMNQAKSEVARLQIDDVLPPDAAELGWAGAALEDEAVASDNNESIDGEEIEENEQKAGRRRDRLARHRAANEEALLRVHPETTPSLWVFVDGVDERNIIERSARAIFGDRLRLEFSTLPEGVHGLRDALDEPEAKGIRRFEARVARWSSVANQVAQGTDGARHVLICAAKDVNRRSEDPVNYFAGLHAMCSLGKANVHHLLPLEIDRKTQRPDIQHFIHRVQSALLDVFLAHSGVVFGVKSFVQACLGQATPKAVYGLQVVRSLPRAFSQEQPVHLILFSRLDVASGISSVRFACRNKNRIQLTEWTPLNEGLRWLGSQRQLSGDDRWVRENFAESTRKLLGQIHEDDPRAVVLVDWSTIAGLWKETSDNALTSSTASRVVLDDADLQTAFPLMTFLRLRADRNATMVLRWVNSTAFEEWRTEPKLVSTRQTTEEKYATTYKTIVELDEAVGRRHHYLMVMGYRNTVQTKRGMSCYRSMWRMSKNSSGWYDRRTLPVAKDNAALPSGLEVTVLQAPKDVQPDNLARLVMGLRLGYAHYDDWTALPAPLFFVSKVRDYIIRYPDLNGSDEAVLLAELPVQDPVDDIPETDPEFSPSAELRSALVAEVLEELPGLVASEAPPEAAPGDSNFSAAHDGYADAEPVGALEVQPSLPAPPESLDDPDLDRALRAALVTPVLHSRKAGPVARKLYEDMLLGNVRVRVDLPWFASRDTVLSPDAWPTDRRAIGEYWRQLSKFHIRLRPERGEAPVVDKFPDWVMRRLAIPQSMYALDIADVFPSSERLFHRIDIAYDRYMEEAKEGETDPARVKFWENMPEFVRWLCTKKDDDALGWVFCGLAHFPSPQIVPNVLRVVDSAALGPRARAGLEYMSNCYEVCRKALDERSTGSRKLGVHLIPATPRPEGIDARELDLNAQGEFSERTAPLYRSKMSESRAAIAMPSPEYPKALIAQAVEALGQTSGRRQPETHSPVPTAFPDASSQSERPVDTDARHSTATQWPSPGACDFDAVYEAAVQRLVDLKQEHSSLLAAQAESQRYQQMEGERIEALKVQIDALNKDARSLASMLTPDLEVGAWHAVDVRLSLGEVPSQLDRDRVQAELAAVREAVSAAKAASKDLELVDTGKFEGAESLGVKDRAKRKAVLLQAAAQRASDAEATLAQLLSTCRSLAPAEVPAVTVDAGDTAVAVDASSMLPTVATELSAAAKEPAAEKLDAPVEHRSDRQVELPIVKSVEQGTAELSAAVVLPGPDRADAPSLVDATPGTYPVEQPVPVEISSKPLVVPLADSLSEAAASAEPDEDSGPSDVVQPPPAGPADHMGPAEATALSCIETGHWALADIAASALVEMAPSPRTQLWKAAVSTLRATQLRQPIDPATVARLEEWLAAQATDHAGANSFADHLGVLGATLLPMLLENSERGIRWAAIQYLRPRLKPFTELHDLVDRIASLEPLHLDITPETMAAARVGLHQALEDGIRRMRQRAASWSMDSALFTNWTANDYRELHDAMFAEKRGFAMAECLASIGRGQDERARKLIPEVLKLADKGLATISDLRKRVGRKKPIEGVGRDHMTSNLRVTSNFVQEFFEQLSRLEGSKQDSLPPKHKEFLQGLYRELQAAKAYVSELDVLGPAAAIHRSLALQSFGRALSLMEQGSESQSVSEEDQILLVEHPLGRDFKPVIFWQAAEDLRTRVPVGDWSSLVEAVSRVEIYLRNAAGDRGAPASAVALQKLLLAAAQVHRSSTRLLAARLIEDRLGRLMKTVPAALVSDNDAAQRLARTNLTVDLQEAQQRVTNAMSLNALLQAEASRMLKVIDSLSRANTAQEIGAINRPNAAYADFPQARAVLRHLVLTPLDKKIQASRELLDREISAFLAERQQQNLDPAELRQLEQKAQLIRARLDQDTALGVRVARSEFLLLREDKLPLLKFDDKTPSHRFEEFRLQARKLTQGQRTLECLHDILSGTASTPDLSPDWLTSLDESERTEAAEFIGTWMQLFRSHRPRSDFTEPLQMFFRGAGVPKEPTVVQRNDGKFFLDAGTFVGLGASGFGVFIPPALGSDAKHIEGVVVPQPTSFAQLGQSVAQLSAQTPTFVLSRQSLTLLQRAQLGREHPVLLVDDDLVAYMAVHPIARLGKLMEVSLLSFYTNPYADYGNRPVPPEMFFGRKDELRKLREVPSAAVLYGGRRLGKSSLLNQIQEESKRNVRLLAGEMGTGEMAVFVPLDSRGDPAGFSQNYRIFSWKAIHKAMVSSNFLQPATKDLLTEQDIRDRIHDEIMAGRAATNACYLLIDEADEVMREDLQADATFLTNLQNLSETVSSRCKLRFVIAGLHNLTRMTTEGNTALGKATSIALQPFSSDTDILNGIDLITKPLAALGFHFGKGDESLPMRIMAVCNFYPAFIQLYCRNLVNRLYNKRKNKDLPTLIGSADLDTVERDKEFLSEIQEKFGLNLNLDKRYKAIALILAEYSYAEQAGGVFAGLTTTEVRDHCLVYAPEHFRTTAAGAYEALLDEMEKLTILERHGSRYQLRTPDIATMLGDKDQVKHLLDELALERPTESRSRGEGRLPLRQKLDAKIFPMPSAWVRNYLQGDNSELVVLVGNSMSGVSTFEKLRDPWDIGQEEASIEARTFNSPEDSRSWGNKVRKQAGARTRLMAIVPRSWHLDQLDMFANIAQTFGKQAGNLDPSTKVRMATMRPVLVASPEQAFRLAERLCDKNATPLRNLVAAPVPVWSDDAVYFRLDYYENQTVRDSPDARRALLQATCGFGEELEKLCTHSLTTAEALAQPDEARKRLVSDLDTFYSRIGISSVLPEEQRTRLEDLLLLMHGEKCSENKELEHMDDLGLCMPHFLFAQWMGLLQPATDGTWEVPAMFLSLIEARPGVTT